METCSDCHSLRSIAHPCGTCNLARQLAESKTEVVLLREEVEALQHSLQATDFELRAMRDQAQESGARQIEAGVASGFRENELKVQIDEHTRQLNELLILGVKAKLEEQERLVRELTRPSLRVADRMDEQERLIRKLAGLLCLIWPSPAEDRENYNAVDKIAHPQYYSH